MRRLFLKPVCVGILALWCLGTLGGCSGMSGRRGVAKPDSPRHRHALDRQADLKGQNSYYYFVVSQLKTLEESQAEAFDFLLKAIKQDRDSSYLVTQKAYFEAARNNLDVAGRDASRALKTDPGNTEAMLLLGKIHSSRREYEKSIELFKKVVQIDPANEEAYNLLARDLLVTDNQALALSTLRQCLVQNPESIACLYYLGSIHFEKKEYDQTLSYFTRIADFNPEQTKILETIGEIYVKKNEFRKALDIFKQISQQNPESLSSQIRVGLLYYQLNETDAAIREFLNINEKFPASDRVNYFLGLLFLEKKQYDRAYPFFDLVPPGSAMFREALNRQFMILKETGQIAKAAELIDKRFPSKNLIEYYNLKSTLVMLQQDYKGAVSILSQGLGRFKNDERLLFQRALANEKLGAWDRAKKDLLTLITLYPDSAEPYNFLGYTMAERGEDLEQALKFLQRAHEIKPNEGHILDSLAWVYFKLGRIDESRPLLERAVKLQPDEPTILEHMGHLQFTLKNKRRAREYFNHSLKLLRELEFKRPEDLKQIQNIEKKLAEF